MMKTNIATTQDQSQRLLRCGVPAGTADICWFIESGKINKNKLSLNTEFIGSEFSSPKGHIEYIPAWSLSALLGLLPKEMGIAVGAYPGSDKYTCFTLIDPDIEPIVADTAIESTVQMIEQLTNIGYKLNEQ